MSDETAKRQWLQRVLGVSFPANSGQTAKGQRIEVAPSVTAVPPPPPKKPSKLLAPDRPRSGKPIQPKALPTKPPVAVKGAGGKPMAVARHADGRVVLTAPRPPVEHITFSGGGGKGAALPGAVRALEASGVLKDVKVISGASVGSMTAALVAAGITAEEFEEIGNDPSVSGKIKQGKNMAEVIFGGGLSGEGLQDLVRTKIGGTLRLRIAEYIQARNDAGEPIDKDVVAIARKLATGKKGPTFGDLRVLSKVIPAIKEVSISGSLMGAVDPETGKLEDGGRSQLVMFNADTEPDLEVALVVHASASLPPVFRPVDIPLRSGMVGRFQDGGVLNNAPTPQSVGDGRDLDPVPEASGMTFVFEGEDAHETLQGVAVPRKQTLGDWLTGAEHGAAEYAKNRDLADRPEDVVMVPLVFTVPPAKEGKKGKKKDFTGFLSGTTNFDIPLEDKLTLQAMAEDATSAHIKKRQEPVAREFASDGQMLICIPRADLQALAESGFEGAAETLAFRDSVTEVVATLAGHVKALGSARTAADDGAVKDALARLEALSSGDLDRQGFVAREMNRDPALDGLLAELRGRGAVGEGEVLEACCAVNDAIVARAHAKTVLREHVYPKLVDLDPKGPSGELLLLVDARLRAANSPEEVDDALDIAIRHFKERSDPLGLKGHRKFAATLESCLMKQS
jgi:exoenzyme U